MVDAKGAGVGGLPIAYFLLPIGGSFDRQLEIGNRQFENSRYNISMRAGIGIISILIAIAIILMVAFSGPGGGYVPTVTKAGNVANSEAAQLSGKDENGVRAQDSIALEADMPGSKLRGLIVKNILPGGPMQTVYSLVKGDEITGTAQLSFRGDTDAELDKDLVFEAYGKNQPLVILRNGRELTLNPDSALTTAQSKY